jgi:hypothetical protein
MTSFLIGKAKACVRGKRSKNSMSTTFILVQVDRVVKWRSIDAVIRWSVTLGIAMLMSTSYFLVDFAKVASGKLPHVSVSSRTNRFEWKTNRQKEGTHYHY